MDVRNASCVIALERPIGIGYQYSAFLPAWRRRHGMAAFCIRVLMDQEDPDAYARIRQSAHQISQHSPRCTAASCQEQEPNDASAGRAGNSLSKA